MAIDVFNYLDYRKYLHDVYHDYKAKDAKFSFRYFSRQAGFKSSSVLKMAISGTRNLTAASAVKCAKALKLKGKELEYFESLVQFNQAKTDKEKDLYFQRLSKLKPRVKLTGITKEQYRFFTRKHYVVIREMVALPDFHEDYAWIAKTVYPSIKVAEAKKAVQTLLDIGLLTRDKDEKLQQADASLTSPSEVESFDLFHFQRELLNNAKDALIEFAPWQRDFTTLVIPIPKYKIIDVKRMIQSFREDVMDYINKGSQDYHDVFYINVQMFPASVTKKNR
jgi:uncharacterized protein (TIGR02147 family)